MKRRSFLKSAALGGGAALGGAGVLGLDAPARASVPSLLARAGLEPFARLARHAGGPRPVEVVDVPLGTGGARRALGDASWSIALRATPVKVAAEPARPAASDKLARPPALELVATFRLDHGAVAEGAVGLGLSFAGWSRANYVLLPGAVYAGNRFESRRTSYPARLSETADIGPHVPAIVGDIPRLNVHAGPSRLEVLAADLATPAVGVHAAATATGVLVLVDPSTRLGLSGLTLEESDDRQRARLIVTAPGVRDEPAYGAGDTRVPSRDRAAAFRAGDALVLRLRVHVFPCTEVGALFEALAAVRKDLTGPSAAPSAGEPPFSVAFKAHEARVDARFVEATGTFATETRGETALWTSGWCGGPAVTLPLLAFGTPRSRARARRGLDFLFREAQAPSGFFRSIYDGARFLDDGPAAPAAGNESARRVSSARHAGRWHLVRRSADALTFAAKHVLVLQRQAPAEAPSARWLAGLGRCADAFVRLWDREKQLGQYVDVESGELIVGGSTAAGLAPAGLALAGALLNRDDCLATAHAAAEHFHERFVRAGLTCGGPGDALQAPDGESAMALLESFVTLYEQTGDKAWLPRATDAARLAASWVVSYDAGDGPRATGAVLSNAQRGRGAPGWTLASGDALFRLYRATGDATLLELLRDTVRNLAQYLPAAERADHAPSGAPAERPARRARADTRDWLDRLPDAPPATSVYDAACLLAYSEIPGVYVRTDGGLVIAFDHVEARLRERAPGRLVVTLKNATPVAAAVRVLGESDAEAARPLGAGALLAARVVEVPAGGTADVDFEAPVAARR